MAFHIGGSSETHYLPQHNVSVTPFSSLLASFIEIPYARLVAEVDHAEELPKVIPEWTMNCTFRRCILGGLYQVITDGAIRFFIIR